MPDAQRTHLYLPAKDRSFWQASGDAGWPLLYLAWGRRDFGGEHIPVSRHDGWVCVLIEEGSPTLCLASEKRKLGPGALALMGPDCAFGWQDRKGNDCRFCLWMWQELELSLHPYNCRAQYLIRLLNRKQQQPFKLLHDLCRRELLDFNPASIRYISGCRMQFEVVLDRTLAAHSQADAGAERLHLATKWMQSHLDSREPIARLCDYLNVSQSSLHRLFKSRTGVSPAARFHELKMLHARDLLRTGKHQVKEVAFTLGYLHFNDFSRAYQQYFGHSPVQVFQ